MTLDAHQLSWSQRKKQRRHANQQRRAAKAGEMINACRPYLGAKWLRWWLVSMGPTRRLMATMVHVTVSSAMATTVVATMRMSLHTIIACMDP